MALDLGIFLEGSQSTFKVKVSDNDSQAQYLLDKLTSSDGSVTITETNDGSIEQIDLTTSGGGGISSPLTTKGDLFTYDTDNQRLGVGTDGQALIADSSEPTGLKWGTVSADNMATADLTLTGDRIHDLNAYTLSILGSAVRHDFDASGYHRIKKVSDNVEEFSYLPISGGSATFGRASSTRVVIFQNTGNLKGYSSASAVNYSLSPVFSSYVCAGNNKFGVGTTSITAKLQVKGTGSTSGTIALLIENSSNTEALKILDNSAIIMANLPTSSAGLATGQLWNNSGVVNIV